MVEFCLTAIAELSSGNPENRQKFMVGGAEKVVLGMMEAYVDDVHVQWQGCVVLGAFSSSPEFAAKVGYAGAECVLNCIARCDETTLGELGGAGCRALSNLIADGSVMEMVRRTDAIEVLREMIAEFSDQPMFQFRAAKLVQLIEGKKMVSPRRGRRLSLVGKSTAPEAAVVPSLQEIVGKADDKVLALLNEMTKEFNKGETKCDPAVLTWGITVMVELGNTPGDSTNLNKFLQGGAVDLVLGIMTAFIDDVHVQWQGCTAIAVLGAKDAAAEQFGYVGFEAALGALARCDDSCISEIGGIAVRAITQLVAVDAVMAAAVQTDAVDVLKGMITEFSSLAQFVFRAQKLLDALVAATPAPAPKKTFNYTCNSMEDRVIHNLLEQVDTLKADIAALEAAQ
jgi:hypothetical protein